MQGAGRRSKGAGLGRGTQSRHSAGKARLISPVLALALQAVDQPHPSVASAFYLV